MKANYQKLKSQMAGDFYTDETMRRLFATDASAYRELPEAVARPKNKNDIKLLINFARQHNSSLIPRTAGTSLAGQVVGSGIVVDLSKYLTKIIEFNKDEQFIWVEPGVVLDELNLFLKPYNLFFAPETSTANRVMMGGMVGNNACGSHSLIYGSTRDHLLEVEAILSDGSEVHFGDICKENFEKKIQQIDLEGKIYAHLYQKLSLPENQESIRTEFPDKEIKRRNNGYAIDILLETNIFSDTNIAFNLAKIIAGSEGTLAFVTAIKLNLVALPPKEKALLCAHFHTLEEALEANLIALKHQPSAVELMDKVILECTLENKEQNENRFFVKGEPEALLIIEYYGHSPEEILSLAENTIKEMQLANLGYHYPLIYGKDMKKVWDLRKAGLGLLSNLSGDAKPVSVVEDTAVNPKHLPMYIKEFKEMLAKYDLSSVYHAHIGTGELHLRPVLNLKSKHDVDLFKKVALETAQLVKKYNGSLSGEHGDGRLRSEFIPLMLGERNYGLIKEIKEVWDPEHIFNPGKIVDSAPMHTQLRYTPGKEHRVIPTFFNFEQEGGILRAAEKCNGSGDCRKSHLIGGTMCPSFQATRDEKNLTRARANILREYLTHSEKINPFDHKEVYEVFDLCLMCKACKTECPSSVDITKLKAEFLQNYYDANGVPFRSWLIAHISKFNAIGQYIAEISNYFLSNSFVRKYIFGKIGFAPKRKFPAINKQTLKQGIKKLLENEQKTQAETVYLFADEFTNFNDSEIGIASIRLLNKLGYRVVIPKHAESGRTYISKGLLRKAKKLANKNIELLSEIITRNTPLIGIEPSAILSFRDEYPDLATPENLEKAKNLAKNTLTIEEFLYREMLAGKIRKEKFTTDKLHIKLHGHCQQKAVASTRESLFILSFPENYLAEEIPSGCCGMAGSFGYENEHYEISMKIGELVLFPEIRKSTSDTIFAAPGTSCRHQIKDGTNKNALHPALILYQALK
jgi:FAD/FMN-containing dehydrogenase/Fe-S oxidoreductase